MKDKRAEIAAQIYRLDYRYQEIKKIAEVIKTDIEKEYNPVFQRLNLMQKDKQEILGEEIEKCEEALNLISELVDKYNLIIKGQMSPIKVFRLYPDFCSWIREILTLKLFGSVPVRIFYLIRCQ